MVIDSVTLKPLHELTKEGKEAYQDYLEKLADDILFKATKPFRYLIYKISEKINSLKESYYNLKYMLRDLISAYIETN